MDGDQSIPRGYPIAQIEAELKALEALLKSATPMEVRKIARARFLDLTNKDERSEQL